MSFETHKKEQFAHFHFSDEYISIEDCAEIASKMAKIFKEGTRNFILSFQTIHTITEEESTQLAQLNSTALSYNGLLIATECDPDIERMLSKKGLICVPTFDEAVDYIYMEEIEKELGKHADDI